MSYSDTDLPSPGRPDDDPENVRTFPPIIEAYLALMAILVGLILALVELFELPFKSAAVVQKAA